MKQLFRIGALLLGFGMLDLYATSIDYTCDVETGFNVTRDSQKVIGYITSLTVGTTALRADLSVKDPTTQGALSAVAVLSQEQWTGGYTDPLKFTGQISTANKQTVALLLSKGLTNLQMQFQFKVFDYDPIKKMYFVALAPASNAVLKATIVKSGTTTQLTVASSPDSTVSSPLNYQMSLQVVPQQIAQSIQYATGSGMTVTKKWGM